MANGYFGQSLGSIVLSLLFSGAAIDAQQVAPTIAERPLSGQAMSSSEPESDDIIVQGYRDRMKLPTRAEIPPMVAVAKSRQDYALSQRIAGCAVRSKLSSLSRLRAVVDGEFNSPTQALAQDRLKRIYITCSESASLAGFTTDGSLPMIGVNASPQNGGQVGTRGSFFSQTGAPVADGAPLGHSILDRGAFMIEAMKTYAPDLSLSRQQTHDPQIQSRFNLREVPRNRYRSPADHYYFQVAVCMTRMEPTLAVRLAMGAGKAELNGVQATLINRARVCVGRAKRVQVNPVQFRIYIADAVYRWVVAARNVASLIPMEKG